VIGSTKYGTLEAAYLYYYATDVAWKDEDFVAESASASTSGDAGSAVGEGKGKEPEESLVSKEVVTKREERLKARLQEVIGDALIVAEQVPISSSPFLIEKLIMGLKL
jgi:hypothetical protein